MAEMQPDRSRVSKDNIPEANGAASQKITIQLVIRRSDGRNILEANTPIGKAIEKKYMERDDHKIHTVSLPANTTVAFYSSDEKKPKIIQADRLLVYKSSVGAIAVKKIIPVSTSDEGEKGEAQNEVPEAPSPQPAEEHSATNSLQESAFSEALQKEREAQRDNDGTNNLAPEDVKQSLPPVNMFEEVEDTPPSPTPQKGEAAKASQPPKQSVRIEADKKTEDALELLLLREAQEQRIELQRKKQGGKGWADALLQAAWAKYPKPKLSLCEMIQDVMHPNNSTAFKLAEKLAPFLKDVVDSAGILTEEARINNNAKKYASEILKRWGEDSSQEDIGIVSRNLSVAQIAARLQDPTLPLAVQAKNLALLDGAIKKELPAAMSSKDSGQRKSAFGVIRDAVQAAQKSKAHQMLKGPEKRDFGSKMSNHLNKINRAEGK